MNGFVEKLRLNNIFNGQLMGNHGPDPLFGGLIPRRQAEQEVIRESRREKKSRREPGVNSRPVARNSGNSNSAVGRHFLESFKNISGAIPEEPMNVVYDPSMEQMTLENKKFNFAQERARIEDEQKNRALDLEGQRISSADRAAMSRNDVERARVELERWKEQNPEGEIKLGADGFWSVINPRTGVATRTNLKSGDLSDEQKSKLKIKEEEAIENIRQKGRKELKEMDIKGRPKPQTRYITPSQQRVAEDDAAAELLRGKYKELADKGLISYDQQGNIVFGDKLPESTGGNWPTDIFSRFGPSSGDSTRINKMMDDFNTEWKALTDARLNKTYAGSTIPETETEVEDPNAEVEMINPRTGKTIYVPQSEVEAARRDGARLPGER